MNLIWFCMTVTNIYFLIKYIAKLEQVRRERKRYLKSLDKYITAFSVIKKHDMSESQRFIYLRELKKNKLPDEIMSA